MPYASINILSFGVNADTGLPIAEPAVGEVAGLARGTPPGATAQRRRLLDIVHGPIVDDPDDLSATGWAILFAEADARADEIAAALQPLIDLRKEKAGARCKILKGKDGYQAGMDAVAWLAARNLALDLVDPDGAMPYYLVIVGDPATISMEFQYRLDVFWAVGRLDFAEVDDYRRYAESVVAYEKGEVVTSRRIGLFAPRHDFDAATQLFHRTVVADLTAAPLPAEFAWRQLLAADATKAAYTALVSGDGGTGTPALIFSGGHGMEFRLGDERQASTQGALVTQDWKGYGEITAAAWVSASDVPADARLHGTIHFVFACYGGGCSRADTFRQRDGTALQISDADRTAELPRSMLLHPHGGALAVVAHVDRAFACSFSLGNGAPQTQGFKDVLWSIMRGHRIGNALDRFNSRWGATSAVLADALRNDFKTPADDARLYQLWISRDDARNYVLLGDPAVRLRIDQMT